MELKPEDIIIINLYRQNPYGKYKIPPKCKKVFIVHRIDKENVKYINDADFGVVISAECKGGGFPATASIDHMRITAYYAEGTGTNTQINIGDAWKEIAGVQINIGDVWKTVEGMQINIGDAWKTIF